MVTIGICTYNRKPLLARMAASLHQSQLPEGCHVRIYDDASTEYDVEALRQLFPEATSIKRQPLNMGADTNTWRMYQDYLQTNDEFFFNADSDLLFRQDWLSQAMSLLPRTDGILSLLNTRLHPPQPFDAKLCCKETLGAAGTLFTRSAMLEIVQGVSQQVAASGVDFGWSRYWRAQGKKLMAVRESLVQHIGFHGFNSSLAYYAYGRGFRVDSLQNGQSINDALEEALWACHDAGQAIDRSYAVFPFAQVTQGAKVILYGAGKTGSDYYKQLQATGYAQVVAIVDKHLAGQDGIRALQDLSSLSFDTIVLCARDSALLADMRRDIDETYPAYRERIVCPEVRIAKV